MRALGSAQQTPSHTSWPLTLAQRPFALAFGETPSPQFIFSSGWASHCFSLHPPWKGSRLLEQAGLHTGHTGPRGPSTGALLCPQSCQESLDWLRNTLVSPPLDSPPGHQWQQGSEETGGRVSTLVPEARCLLAGLSPTPPHSRPLSCPEFLRDRQDLQCKSQPDAALCLL